MDQNVKPANMPVKIVNDKSENHNDLSGCLLFILLCGPLVIIPVLYFLDNNGTMFWLSAIFYSVVYLWAIVLWIRKHLLPKHDEIMDEAKKTLQNLDGIEKKILQNFIDCCNLSIQIDTLEKIVSELKDKAQQKDSKKYNKITQEKELDLEELVKKLNQIQYDVDKEVTLEDKEAYRSVCSSFERLMDSDKVWSITSIVKSNQVKSWADDSITRGNASLYFGVFNYLKSEFDIPVFDLGETKFYFYPKFVIKAKSVYDFKVYPHGALKVKSNSVAFSESSVIPEDGSLLYYAWQYVNKDGSPDRRFIKNSQLPVFKYSILSINMVDTTEKVMFSNFALAENFTRQYNLYNVGQVLNKDSCIDKDEKTLDPGIDQCLQINSGNMNLNETSERNIELVTSPALDFFYHLKKLSVVEAVNNILHFYKCKLSIADSFSFSIQNQLAFIALYDLSNCCKRMGYDVGADIKEGGEVFKFIALLTASDLDNDIHLIKTADTELNNLALQFWKNYSRAFRINFASHKLLLVEILSTGCIESSLIDSYVVLLYRLMSYLTKVDKTVTPEESALLSSIMDSLTNHKYNIAMYNSDNGDPLLYEAAKIIIGNKSATASLLQQHLEVGYNRATRLLNELEQHGVVSKASGHFAQRTVLVDDISQVLLQEDSIRVLDVVDMCDDETTNFTKTSQLSNRGMALESLNELIGLEKVKEDVTRLINYVKIQQLRKEEGLSVKPLSLHSVFTGNPGTGKTIVARILAEIYRDLGVLRQGHLVETDRSGLVAEYVGQTAVKTNKIIDSALDGVLFIDEAYSLVHGGNDDYGHEAVSTLLKRMEDDRDRLIVILAGYEEEMQVFLESNPGLYSRFNKYLNFPDYSANDLIKMFKYYLNKYDYVLDKSAEACLLDLFNSTIENKDRSFGNARFARNVLEESLQRQATRLASLSSVTKETLRVITTDDIPADK